MKSKADNLERLRGNKLLQKRVAKYIARFCFRDNTILEDIHADPDSRISQKEMRELMIGAVQNCYMVVGLLVDEIDNRPGRIDALAYNALFTGSPGLLDALEHKDFNPEWDDPVETDLGAGRRRLGLAEEKGVRAKKKPRPRATQPK
jgi:hypothetical protein